jgi:hypothetical protein
MNMKKQNETSQPLSYESDGKMGKNQKQKGRNQQQKDFFNITQDSE